VRLAEVGLNDLVAEIDVALGLALALLTDLDFGDWAKTGWPALSDAVLLELGW